MKASAVRIARPDRTGEPWALGSGAVSVGRVRALLAAVLASFVLAAPASAFTPPELFVRAAARRYRRTQPASDWIPLASAPTFNYIGGYQIGYRLQPTGVEPATSRRAGAHDPRRPRRPADAADQHAALLRRQERHRGRHHRPVGSEIQYEGNGTYAISVSVGGDPVGSGCIGAAGATSSGSFTVDAHVAPQLVGAAVRVPRQAAARRPVRRHPRRDPPGGFADNTLRAGRHDRARRVA